MNDTSRADKQVADWLDGLRDGPTHPLPDRLTRLPEPATHAMARATNRRLLAAAAIVLIGAGVVIVRRGPSRDHPAGRSITGKTIAGASTTEPRAEADARPVIESPLRRLTRLRPARLVAHSATVHHERGVRRISTEHSILGDRR